MRPVIRILFILFVGLTGCKKEQQLSAPDYMSYIENKSNGLKNTVTLKDYEYTFLYKPAEYIAYKELTNANIIDSTTFKKRVRELHKTVWFNIYIKTTEGKDNPLKSGVSGLDEYNARVSYFLSDAANNLTLYYGQKGSMNNVAYHFENNYGLTPMDVIVVGFEIPDDFASEDIVLEYDDRLFNSGPIKVKVSKKELLDIPQIIL